MADEMIIDGKKDNPDTYALRESAVLPETIITPSDSGDIFAIKKENVSQLGSLVGMVLGEGVFLRQAYRLDKLLSRDETGEIWKASDIQESRNVVVYLPPLEKRKDESAIELIQKNAKHVEALEHLRIVPQWENLIDPEHGFFTVRKLIPGKTLDVYRTEYVRRHGKLAPTKVIKMLNDIAHALDYAHSVDIVHGDLCLKNIIVGLDDAVYVDNFALLPIQAAEASQERKPYFAPEIIEGHVATAHSDVFSLAVIAYNLLSGRLPFFPPDTIDDTPLPIPNVPGAVDAIILKAMSKEPEDRYDSCSAFARALEAGFQEAKKIQSVVVAPKSKPTNSNKTTFRIALLGVLIGLLGIVGIVAAVWYQQFFTAELPFPEMEIVHPVMPPEPKPVDKPVIEIPTPPIVPIPKVQPPDDPPNNMEESIGTTEEIIATPLEVVPPPPAPAPTPIVIPPTEPKILPLEPVVEIPIVGINDSARLTPVEVEAPPPQQPNATALDLSRHDAGERKVLDIEGVEYAFRWCPPGQFMRGSPENEQGRKEDETRHQVILTRGFWIQETEVTQEQWRRGVRRGEENPSFSRGSGRLPVENVSWNDCRDFIDRLNERGQNALANEELAEYRFALPTEAQWEYACRAGTATAFFFGEDLDSSDVNVASEGTRPVGSGKPNVWGIYDMHGNVREWCCDRYGDYPTGLTTDPAGALSSTMYAHRGGSWGSNTEECRSAHRSRGDATQRSRHVGFRLVIVP